LAFRKIEVRLAKTVLRNLIAIGNNEYCCSLDQADLAPMVGTSKEVVGQCLKVFLERGILMISKKRSPRMIIIKKRSLLEKIAYIV